MSVRKLEINDIESVMKIWLETNIQAHWFVAENYWRENFDMVQQALPQADVWVYDENGVKGFVGVADDGYIAGFFVERDRQGQGIGSALLNHLKNQYRKLSLCVYVKNNPAVQFYLKQGFQICRQQVEMATNEAEYVMSWSEI